MSLGRLWLQTENEGKLGFELWPRFADFARFFCAFALKKGGLQSDEINHLFQPLVIPKIFYGLLLDCPWGQRPIKKYKMVDGTSRRLCVSHFLFNGADFCEEGTGTFQVVRQTGLEVDLERMQNYCMELLALYLDEMIT